GYGTTLVATLGVSGAILAYLIADIFEWRAAYFIGGGLGLVLLVMRVRVFESGTCLKSNSGTVQRGNFLMLLNHRQRLRRYLKCQTDNVQRGNFFMLFNHRERFFRYVKCILVGLPIWFVSGIMITFSPELGAAIGVDTPVDAGIAVILAFASQTFGNISSGV